MKRSQCSGGSQSNGSSKVPILPMQVQGPSVAASGGEDPGEMGLLILPLDGSGQPTSVYAGAKGLLKR